MFDKNYYQEKKQKLIAKANQLQNDYLQSAFKFVKEVQDIQDDMKQIENWEKEQKVEPKVEEVKLPETK